MEEKELVINKPNEVLGVINKKDYTKLTLNCKVNPKFLRGFDNVRELTISSENNVSIHLNEQFINFYTFKDNLEKINFINVSSFGTINKKTNKKSDSNIYQSLNCPNLKSVSFESDNFCYYGLEIYNRYLAKCNNLREIKIQITKNFSRSTDLYLPKSIKTLVINMLGEDYIVNFSYSPEKITNLYFDNPLKSINLVYDNYGIKTYVEFDVISKKSKERTYLNEISDKYVENNSFNIPDYITDIDFSSKNYYEKIENISFNINLLNSIKEKTNITDNIYLELLKTITIRNNSEMSLFKEKVINVNETELLKDLYINDNKLFIVYDNKALIVDSDGVITKQQIGNDELLNKEEIFQENIIEEQKRENTFELDKYSISELEYYLHYRKLLELIKDDQDEDFINTVNSIGKKVLEKLNNGETHE